MYDVIDTMQDYIKDLKATIKELESLESQATELRGKADAVDEQHKSLETNIEALESKIEALRQERKPLVYELAETQLTGDVSEQKRLMNTAKQIDKQLNENEQEIVRLTAELEQLPDYAEEAVELAVALDRLSIPSAYDLAENIRRGLVKATQDLGTRKQTTRNNLPAFDAETYDAVRRDQDEEYAKRKAHQEQQDRLARQKLAAKEQAARVEKRAINNGDGYVIGWHVVDRDTGQHVAYEPIADHSVDEVRSWVEDRAAMRREAATVS